MDKYNDANTLYYNIVRILTDGCNDVVAIYNNKHKEIHNHGIY